MLFSELVLTAIPGISVGRTVRECCAPASRCSRARDRRRIASAPVRGSGPAAFRTDSWRRRYRPPAGTFRNGRDTISCQNHLPTSCRWHPSEWWRRRFRRPFPGRRARWWTIRGHEIDEEERLPADFVGLLDRQRGKLRRSRQQECFGTGRFEGDDVGIDRGFGHLV